MQLFQSVTIRIRLICLLCILFLITNISEAAFTENEYQKVAKNFLLYLQSVKTIKSIERIRVNQKMIGRIFHLKAGGYLVMPETTILPPIKAYSLKTDYQTLPKAYQKFIINELNLYQKQTSNTSGRSSSKNNACWNFLLNNTPGQLNKKQYIPNTILLETTWNQNFPYNKMLPKINGANVLAGCTQAAQAQIMKFHQHPDRGKGVASHTWNNQHFETVLFRDYHWKNMPNHVDNATPEHVQDEVALLFRDLAIVNKANFGISGTSSSMDVYALYEYFGYGTDIKEMTNANESEFFSVIRNEIDNQRPVLLSLPNHATVADGYASDPTGKKIHINMGWGGHDDDFYYLNQTIVTENYIFPTASLSINYNIKPCDPLENNCYDNLSSLEAEDFQDGFQISGKFDTDNDMDAYRQYLKGDSKIEGDRGYLNQAFYISVYNSKDELVVSSDETIHIDFPLDFYTIKISLNSYSFDSHDSYEVNIKTQSVSDTEIDIIHNQDELPVINTELNDQIVSLGGHYQVRIDAVDKNGDMVYLNAISSTNIVNTTILDDVLTITPTGNVGHARIFINAQANGKQVQKYFDVLICDTNIGWGKEFKIQGVFENQSDYNTHPLLLDQQCQISGNNGFSNQAFFTSVLDNNQNTIIDLNDQTINQTFNKAIYQVGVSLEGDGRYYSYKPAHSGYTLFINCPNASWTFQDIADIFDIEINDTNTMTLRHAILYLQILSGYSVPDIGKLMIIQNVPKIEIKDVLKSFISLAENE